MKTLFLSIALSLFLAVAAYAQQRMANQVELHQAPDFLFQKTIDYLLERDYFIANVDQAAGFIQATQFIPRKRAFSPKSGEQRTFNFFIQPGEQREISIVRLQIHTSTKMFGGDIHNKTYYFDDEGISKDQMLYDEVLEGFVKYTSAE